MGRKRGKVQIEFVENLKTRNQIFKRRKECLVKKIKELTALCDVNACMVIIPHDAPATVWPPNDQPLFSRLVHPFLGVDDDDEKAPIAQKKSQLIRAQIADQKKTLISKKQSESPDLQPQQNQGGLGYEESSTGMMMPFDEIDDQYHHHYQQQQEQEQLGPLMMMPRGPLVMDDDDDGSSSSFYPQQQQMNSDSSSSMYQEEDYSSTAMMNSIDQMMMMDDNFCGMGFDEQPSRQTAAADDFYDVGLITQLYTPPMMMWQSNDGDLSTQFQDKDYLQYINLDNIWA